MTRLADLFRKWTADCDSVADMTEKLIIEQLLDTVPAELRVWLSEKKPTTGLEAGRMADDYVLATKPKPPVAKGGQDNSPVRRCYTCGQEGDVARNFKNSSQGQTQLEGALESKGSTQSGTRIDDTNSTTKTDQNMRDRRATREVTWPDSVRMLCTALMWLMRGERWFKMCRVLPAATLLF